MDVTTKDNDEKKIYILIFSLLHF